MLYVWSSYYDAYIQLGKFMGYMAGISHDLMNEFSKAEKNLKQLNVEKTELLL